MRHFKYDLRNIDRMRFCGVAHPRVWQLAKRGRRDAIAWIAEDLEDLAQMGGFLGGVYKRAARRLRNIELCVR
jgi:hypothetical protein